MITRRDGLIDVQVQEECVAIGLIPVLAGLLTTKDVSMVVVTHSAAILTKLAGARGFPEDVQKHGVYAALVHAITNANSYDVLTAVCTVQQLWRPFSLFNIKLSSRMVAKLFVYLSATDKQTDSLQRIVCVDYSYSLPNIRRYLFQFKRSKLRTYICAFI